MTGVIDKTRFKESFYSFFKGLKNIDADVKKFWDLNETKIKKWYIEMQKEDDLVISASPKFLLSEICTRISIKNLIASEVDKCTGKYSGENCHGPEKVIRFKNQFDTKIDSFYSDSHSDQPMANIAEKAYLVKKDIIKEWV